MSVTDLHEISGFGRTQWRAIIVGGGPAAVQQLQTCIASGVAAADVLLVSETWGAPGMAFLGDSRLQSYVHELRLQGADCSVMTSPGFVQPTGTEYDHYVRQVLEASGAQLLTARVFDVSCDSGAAGFGVSVGTAVQLRTFTTPCVIVATGTRPKQPTAEFSALGASTYDQVYRDIAAGEVAAYRSRPVYVVGGGNSAMQTAGLLAAAGASVTILAKRYLGMYPTETADRFAWRAPSQLTWELVVKSTDGERSCESGRLCVRFLVYRSIKAADDASVRVQVAVADNTHQMGTHSRPGLHPHVSAAQRVGGWEETAVTPALIWATGCEPVYPNAALITGLPKDDEGYLVSDLRGQTACPGLFVTGSCAGRRSVNEMVPALAFEVA